MKAQKQGNTIPPEETAMFCEQVAMILHSGILLEDGMDAMRDAYAKSKYADRFKALADSVHKTGSLYQAVSESGLFPKYLIQSVRVGEASGTLEDNMTALAEFYAGEARTRADIRAAITYPLVLMGMMLILLVVLVSRVFPIFSQVVSGLPANTAAASLEAVRFGSVIVWIVLGLAGLVVVAAVILLILLHSRYRAGTMAFVFRTLPSLRRINSDISTHRIADSLGRLLSGGYPIEEALALTQNLLPEGDTVTRLTHCRELVSKGEAFAKAAEDAEIFSPLHGKMLCVGAATGQMDKTLLNISRELGERADERINRLTGTLEPLLVALLAVVLGALLLSVMLPLAGVLTIL